MEDKMKTLVVSLVALLFAFFVGCQSSITDPVVSDTKDNFGSVNTENFASKDWINSLPGVIDLTGMIQVPGLLMDELAEIDGSIKYAIDKVYYDSRPPAPQSALKVSMYANAKITCFNSGNDDVWTAVNASEDLVYTSNQNGARKFFTKTIRVKNACPAPLDLVLKFQVTEKDLTLSSMQLKIRAGWTPTGDPGS
jgi:hypothetical protein